MQICLIFVTDNKIYLHYTSRAFKTMIISARITRIYSKENIWNQASQINSLPWKWLSGGNWLWFSEILAGKSIRNMCHLLHSIELSLFFLSIFKITWLCLTYRNTRMPSYFFRKSLTKTMQWHHRLAMHITSEGE